MTNELGSTLQDIEAKAERKREALEALTELANTKMELSLKDWWRICSAIRKYIEEN